MKGPSQSCTPPFFAYPISLRFFLSLAPRVCRDPLDHICIRAVYDDGGRRRAPTRGPHHMNEFSVYGVPSLYLVPIPQIFLYVKMSLLLIILWAKRPSGRMTCDLYGRARACISYQKRIPRSHYNAQRPSLPFAHLLTITLTRAFPLSPLSICLPRGGGGGGEGRKEENERREKRKANAQRDVSSYNAIYRDASDRGLGFVDSGTCTAINRMLRERIEDDPSIQLHSSVLACTRMSPRIRFKLLSRGFGAMLVDILYACRTREDVKTFAKSGIIFKKTGRERESFPKGAFVP